jgi:dihydrofolate reductase
MRKLIIEEWITVDGHAADRMGRLDFFTSLLRDMYTDGHRTRFLETIDCILMGRKTYEQFVTLWPDRPVENDALADKINHAQKIVISGTLIRGDWGKWEPALVKSGDVVEIVKEIKAMPGKDIVLWGSISLAQTLMQAKLADEIYLHVCPTITAGGKKLFSEQLEPTAWQLIETKQYNTGIVFLRYQAG